MERVEKKVFFSFYRLSNKVSCRQSVDNEQKQRQKHIFELCCCCTPLNTFHWKFIGYWDDFKLHWNELPPIFWGLPKNLPLASSSRQPFHPSRKLAWLLISCHLLLSLRLGWDPRKSCFSKKGDQISVKKSRRPSKVEALFFSGSHSWVNDRLWQKFKMCIQKNEERRKPLLHLLLGRHSFSSQSPGDGERLSFGSFRRLFLTLSGSLLIQLALIQLIGRRSVSQAPERLSWQSFTWHRWGPQFDFGMIWNPARG